ncbi:MAG TPA: RNA polymerase sigma factor [Chloroflexota bacterium]|nr:RNA polymerase sigma factor [Chloroflexota bacterium]
MELARALSADLDRAFPRLVEEQQHRLYRVALRLTANPHDAEDIAQEALVRAYRWLQAHRPLTAGFPLGAWLRQVTVNVFRNRVRKRAIVSGPLEEAAYAAETDGVSPAGRAELRETSAELALSLARLPLRYREAVVLRHVEELSYPEIASALGRPEGTVKSDVHRGLALLRAALQPIAEEVLV